MCYAKPGPRCSYHARQALNKANAAVDAALAASDQEGYITARFAMDDAQAAYDRTPAGIAAIEESGKPEDLERAKQYKREREDALRKMRSEALTAPRGYGQGGIFAETGTHYDADGYDWRGIDRDGYDREGYHCETSLDREGYTRDGYSRDGFDRYGYNGSGYDRDGFDRNGFDHYGMYRNGTPYDAEGYDRQGFDRNEIHRETGTRFDPIYGVDARGYDRDGFHEVTGYDREGYDRRGYDGGGYDREGYHRDGYDRDGVDRDGYDRNGFARDGIHRETGTEYGPNGYDRDGYDDRGLDDLRNLRGTGLRGRDTMLLGYVHGYDQPFTPTQVSDDPRSSWTRDDVRECWDHLAERGYIEKSGRRWAITDSGREIVGRVRAIGYRD